MPTEQQLISALRQADEAGDTEAAQRFAQLIRDSRSTPVESENDFLDSNPVPGFNEGIQESFSVTDTGGTVGDAVRSVGQGVSLGFLDEAQAGLLATIGTALPESLGGLPEGKSLSENFRGIRDAIRDDDARFSEANPKLAVAGELVGGALTAGTGLAKTAGTKLAATKTGAVLGGAAGAGFSEAELVGDDKDISGFIGDVALSSIFGTAGGAALDVGSTYLASRVAKSDHLKKLISNGSGGSSKAVDALSSGVEKTKVKATAKAVGAATKQGFDEGVVNMIVGSNKVDKSNMRKMVNSIVKAKKDPKNGLRSRPSDVLGQSVAKRYRYVENQKKLAGEAVDKQSRALENVQVDYDDVAERFYNTLEDSGVSIDRDGGVLNFKRSDFEDLDGSMKAVKNVSRRLSQNLDARGLHRLKRYIDNNIQDSKASAGITGQAESLLKSLRSDVDGLLDGQFSAYDIANQRYSKSIGALNGVNDLLGKSNADDRTLGTLSRRISSNAMSGSRVDDALIELNRTANEMGGKFTDDFDTLVVFSNELERRFGSSARTSLQGQAENVIDKGLSRTVIDAAGQRAKDIIGVNDENAIKAVRRLLTQ